MIDSEKNTVRNSYVQWLAFPLWLLMNAAFAMETCHVKPGNVICNEGNVRTLSVNGQLLAKGTTVTNQLSVNGNLNAIHLTVRNLDVNGSAVLRNTTVLGHFTMRGGLEIVSSTVENPLNLYSDQAYFVDSTLADIRIHKTSAANQLIHLNKNCHVTGSIVFDSGHGIVIAQKGAIIDKVVKGAQIRFQ